MQFIYQNPKGQVIFTPVYKTYNKIFFKNILADTKLNFAFKAYKDTAFIEKYLLNAAQFSAAKSASEAKMLQQTLLKEDGTVKGFSEFRKDAREITDITQNTWLRTEYDSQRKQMVSIDQFTELQNNADLYPYWQYKGVMDNRERPEHVELENKIFRIGDPAGDACFPPNGWNCRCAGEPVDDSFLRERGLQPVNNAQKLLNTEVDEQFRFNAAKTGSLPNNHSYFQTFPSANAGNGNLFGYNSPDIKSGLRLDAKGAHAVVEVYTGWAQRYYTDKRGVIFQNKQLLSNIIFNNNSLHAVINHGKGIDMLPDALQNPDEVWAMWQDDKTQQVSMRRYIKGQYIVFTTGGQVTDAYLVSKSSINGYRKGVPLI